MKKVSFTGINKDGQPMPTLKATPVTICGLDLVLHHSFWRGEVITPYTWTISDPVSRASIVSSRRTRKEAVADAENLLTKVGADLFYKRRNERLSQTMAKRLGG